MHATPLLRHGQDGSALQARLQSPYSAHNYQDPFNISRVMLTPWVATCAGEHTAAAPATALLFVLRCSSACILIFAITVINAVHSITYAASNSMLDEWHV